MLFQKVLQNGTLLEVFAEKTANGPWAYRVSLNGRISPDLWRLCARHDDDAAAYFEPVKDWSIWGLLIGPDDAPVVGLTWLDVRQLELAEVAAANAVPA